MNPGEDHRLGATLANLIREQGEQGLDNGRIQASLQDLLGADTSLLLPLKDLLARPTFRNLLLPSSDSILIGGRDALLDDLAAIYSPAMVTRLGHLLDGVMGLPMRPQTSTPAGSAAPAPTAVPPSPFPAAQVIFPTMAPQVNAARSQGGGVSALVTTLIALLALLSGALVVGLGWMMQQKQSGGSVETVKSTTPPPSASVAPPAPAERETPRRGTTELPDPPRSNPGAWGDASAYKFGRAPGGDYPDSCAFSETDSTGKTIISRSSLDYWACRDEGGNASDGYRVVWADGKSTLYTFGAGGKGMIIGTNGDSYPMSWYNDNKNGTDVVVINHEDGATSWIPGNVSN